MKKFLKTILLFLLPIALTAGLFYAALLRSGELCDTHAAAQSLAEGEPLFMGLAYRDDTRAIKQLVASEKKAELLVLGTSRSMQFRGGFFETDSFYNAGGAVAFAPDFLPFLQSLPKDALPSRLLVVLDQYFYNESWGAKEQWPGEKPYTFTKAQGSAYLWRAMQNYASGRFSLKNALFPQENTLGLAAAGRGSGFYPDGSYSYGRQALDPSLGSDVGFQDTYQRIFLGTNRFEFGDTPCAFDLAATEELLAFCKENGIQVTAVLPPYAPSVYQRMESSGKYGYLDALMPALKPVFEQYGFEIFDYTYLPETNDAQYIDGFHGSDRVYAALCARLADDSAFLSPYLDGAFLRQLAAEDGPACTVTLPKENPEQIAPGGK